MNDHPLIDPLTGRFRIPELQVRMHCDGAANCQSLVAYAVRVMVPSKTPMAPNHEWLRMTLDLHCCEEHRGFLDRESFIDDKIKALFEDAAKRKRPIGFKCEFQNAFIDYVDVRSREYQAFLASPKGQMVLNMTAKRKDRSLVGL